MGKWDKEYWKRIGEKGLDFLIKVFRPKFYHRITWYLIILAAGLFSVSLLELIVYEVFNVVFNIPIASDKEATYGMYIIVSALCYNVISQLIDMIGSAKTYSNSQSQKNTVDALTYKRFMEVLPSEGSMKFVNDISIVGGSFRKEDTKQLHDFIYECGRPEFTFVDDNLEQIKLELLESIKDIVNIIAVHGGVSDVNVDIYTMKKDWEYSDPEEFHELRTRCFNLQDACWESYDKLVKLGRLK